MTRIIVWIVIVFGSTVALCHAGAEVGTDNKHNVYFSEQKWIAVSDSARLLGKPEIDVVTGVTRVGNIQNGCRVEGATLNIDHGTEFSVKGQAPNHVSMKWQSTIKTYKQLGNLSYYIIRYKAEGIIRNYTPYSIMSLSGVDDSNKTNSFSLLNSSEVIVDGKWHVALKKKNCNVKIENIDVALESENTSAYIIFDYISAYDSFPLLLDGFDYLNSWDTIKNLSEFDCMDISPLFNYTLGKLTNRIVGKENNIIVDGAIKFKNSQIVVSRIPFLVAVDGNDIICPKEVNGNNAVVNVLGENVQKEYFFPEARNDEIAINIGKKTSEIYMILVSEFPAVKGFYGRPSTNYRIDDIENISVELQYQDGETELAFPYSISDEGFIIQRMADAYAVPADPNRVLQKLVLRNNIYGINVGIAAVTVNTSVKPILSSAWHEDKIIVVPPVQNIDSTKAKISRNANIFTIKNAYYTAEFDCNNGFSINKLINNSVIDTAINLAPTSGLEMIVDGNCYTGKDFDVNNVDVEQDKIRITLQGKKSLLNLKLVLTINFNESQEIAMQLAVKNTGDRKFKATVRFPIIKDLMIGSLENTYYFFPQYRNVIDNENGFYRQAHGCGFVLQLFDIYNPVYGSGLCLLTHNIDLAPLTYCMAKGNNGVSAYIEYEAKNYVLNKNEEISFPETVLAVHQGDWRNGVDIYKKWSKTWYKPVRSQDKDWFKNSFYLRGHIISKPMAKEILMIPPVVFDHNKRSFRIDETVELDKKWLGIHPDIMHFFQWAYDDNVMGSAGVSRNGEYSTKDYNNIGGLEGFHKAIDEIQEKHKMHASLYTLFDRYNVDTEFYKRFGKKFCVMLEDGSPVFDNGIEVYICKGFKDWRQHCAQTTKRVAEETGAQIMYLDVFPAFSNASCYNTEHGHKIPYEVSKQDYFFIKEVRESLDPQVAIFSEYPGADVINQFMDGFHMYDFMALNELFATSWDRKYHTPNGAPVSANVCRFVYPSLKQIALPCGIEGAQEWSDVKLIFFNGQAYSDSTWRLLYPKSREMLGKAISIYRKYSDCINSPEPEMFVPTLKAGVYVNKFPGKGQTLYTIYNTRYITVQGKIIMLEHKEGVKYFDVWHGKELFPVIENGKAIISLKLDPQGLGCILQK